MDADLARLPTGTAGWLALANHAVGLGDLSEVDYLELKGSLPFAEKGERKRSAVLLSRAILGMANRMPDLAEKHLGGAGVIFVGISDQAVVGAESVDGAVLIDAVQAYVGENGPRWDYQFIDHPDGRILAIIVDPPQWGDGIHACRKDYADNESKLAVRDGDVFVRVPGKTRPATSHDLSQLELRRAKAPHTGAKITVSYAGMFDRASRDNVHQLVDDLADSVADDLIDSVPEQTPRPYGSAFDGLFGTSFLPSGRRPEDYHAKVERWRDKCREATPHVVTEFLRHTLEHGAFVVENESDRYLEGVRVQVTFPPGVEVLIASDTDYCDHGGQFDVFQMLPDRPPKYERWTPYDLPFAVPPVDSVVKEPVRQVTVERTNDGVVLSWSIGDLPSQGRAQTAEEFAVFTDEHRHEHHEGPDAEDHPSMVTKISGRWQVTARGVHHVFDGELALECRQDPGAVATWRRATP